MFDALTSDQPAVTSTCRDLIVYTRFGKNQNRVAQLWADVTDVQAAASEIVLRSVDFHSFLEIPISLDEQATERLMTTLAKPRVVLSDTPVLLDAD